MVYKTKNGKPNTEVFADVYAATHSPGKAIAAAQPTLEDKKLASVKANRMLKKSDVQHKIQQKLEKMSKTATERVEELIRSENEIVATTNSWRVIEQLRGKPIARNLNMQAQVNIEDALFE